MKVQIKKLDSVTHNDTTATKLINDNFKAIQDEIELQLSRDGKEPNFMDADLDMNSHKIINSAYPTEDIDVATKGYVDDVAGNAAEYASQASASAARAAVSEQHAAVYAQVAEDARAQVDGLINNDGFKAVAEDLQSTDSSIKKTASNIEDIHKAALLDPTSIEKAGLIGEHINEILPITDHLNEIDTVSANVASVNTVSTNIDNVNRVAGADDNIRVVATNIGNVNTVSTNIDNVNRVAPHAEQLSQLDNDVEQLLKQINGEGGLDSMVSGDNVTQATMSARGTARFATDSEAQAGTSADVMITPKQLKQYGGGGGSSVDTYTKTEIDGMFNNVAAIENNKVNVDADNFTAIGKSTLASYSMPSSRFIDLTLGASGSTYTAPANGILTLRGQTTSNNKAYGIINNASLCTNLIRVDNVGNEFGVFMLAQKGQSLTVIYEGSLASGYIFRFIYAEGDK